MKKILIRAAIGLAVLLIIAIVVIGLTLDKTIKRGVETYGPRFTKVSVKLDKVTLSLLSGAGGIQGLVVGNPEGYKTPEAISVGSASLAVSPASLLSDKIVVKSIKVDAPQITLEAGLNGNNLSQILENVKETTGGNSTNAPVPEQNPAPTSEAQAGKKLQVDEFIISGARLNVNIVGLRSNVTTLTLQTISLPKLGQGPEGITSAELTQLALEAICKASLKAASEADYDFGKMADNLKKDALKSVDQGTVDDAKKLGKSLNELFKKK